MPGSVFSPRAERNDAGGIQACPLNVGDTWLQPFEGGRMEDLNAEDHPELHRYAATRGIPPLIDAIVEKVRNRNGLSRLMAGAGMLPDFIDQSFF